MSINIRLKVKFRAFFIDLAKFDKAWTVSLPLAYNEISPNDEPEGSKVILNRNGVRLSVWA